MGAGAQNSFGTGGYNVLDTSAGAGWSPYHHTPNDLIENVDLPICRALAAVNVAAGAAVAGVVGEEPNLPPETILAENCAATHSLLTLLPLFEWSTVDFDGEVASHEYRITPLPGSAGDVRPHDARLERSWIELPLSQTSIVPPGLTEGDYHFEIRAVDDSGVADPTPASHTFTATGSLCPTLRVEICATQDTVEFSGSWLPGSVPRFKVFEGEHLVFRLEATAEDYCGTADAAAVAIGDNTDWSDWESVPHDFVIVPELGDTAVYFLTEDENGSRTVGKIAITPIQAGMELPLLHVDDWFAQSVPEAAHDAFYDSILSGLEHDTWDPYEHISGTEPQLPSMQDLAGYRTVLWSLGASATLLHPAQSESGYHTIEGFVRAGGNLIVEGHSTIEALAANGPYEQWRTFGEGEFVHDPAGIDSMYNTGSMSSLGNLNSYGYEFLGGISIAPWDYAHLPVDTLVKWQEGYAEYGGLPSCEVYRPSPTTTRLHLFDAYQGADLDEKPCATLRLPDDGTGSVAVLGFPLYYIETDAARSVVHALLTDIIEWQEPAELVSFSWEETPDSTSFTWYLSPRDGPLGCYMERRVAGSDDDYASLTLSPLSPDAVGWYHYTDASSVGWTSYSYRLRVLECCGGTTIHGPWEIATPLDTSAPRLLPPFPNPTTGETMIRYVVEADHRWTSVDVFSLDGRLVRSLFEGPREAGGYTVHWDRTGNDGRGVAAGIYFVRARIGTSELTRKIAVLR
ncbi:T9SS type A sorting domain-containing protein [bacterium]|nr:T9SS type A sorting domain-containing protein [bacterium]